MPDYWNTLQPIIMWNSTTYFFNKAPPVPNTSVYLNYRLLFTCAGCSSSISLITTGLIQTCERLELSKTIHPQLHISIPFIITWLIQRWNCIKNSTGSTVSGNSTCGWKMWIGFCVCLWGARKLSVHNPRYMQLHTQLLGTGAPSRNQRRQ